MNEYSKNEILFSEAIGVCRVSEILNVSSHHVLLRPLITVEEAHNRENAENLSMQEKQEIEYILQKDRKEQPDV